jgi:hypothetical protein
MNCTSFQTFRLEAAPRITGGKPELSLSGPILKNEMNPSLKVTEGRGLHASWESCDGTKFPERLWHTPKPSTICVRELQTLRRRT